jgi:uracil-DNA glycosylase family 4
VNPDQAKEHLRFAAELGVDGVSRDPAWRSRPDDAGRTHGSAPTRDVERAARPADAVGADPRVGPDPSLLTISRTAAEALAAVRADIGDCTRCKLHGLGRRQIVFGVGNPNADLMFVGEAPGGDEDVQGIPFVGRAGQLLTKIIEAIELRREDVYIANVIKCRPPQNRNPEPDEVDTCEPFLFRQIEIIKPKVIVALGKFGAQTLLRTLDPISRLRGRVYEFRGAKLIPTFHPAYLLRNPASKREVWEDMKLVKRLLQADSGSGSGS